MSIPVALKALLVSAIGIKVVLVGAGIVVLAPQAASARKWLLDNLRDNLKRDRREKRIDDERFRSLVIDIRELRRHLDQGWASNSSLDRLCRVATYWGDSSLKRGGSLVEEQVGRVLAALGKWLDAAAPIVMHPLGGEV